MTQEAERMLVSSSVCREGPIQFPNPVLLLQLTPSKETSASQLTSMSLSSLILKTGNVYPFCTAAVKFE